MSLVNRYAEIDCVHWLEPGLADADTVHWAAVASIGEAAVVEPKVVVAPETALSGGPADRRAA